MWEQIQQKLARLANLDREYRVFGASSHRYQRKPVATTREVAKIEAHHGVALPDDYRAYTLVVANGGVGPFHGLFRLGQYCDGVDSYPWDEGPFRNSPATPFVLTEAWNLPADYREERDQGDPSERAERDAVESLARIGIVLPQPSGKVIGKNPFNGEPILETWDSLISNAVYSNDLLNGTIPIATQGCGLGVSLVVCGAERGNVWFDLRADFRGVVPANFPGKRRLTFLEWYEAWLDAELNRFT